MTATNATGYIDGTITPPLPIDANARYVLRLTCSSRTAGSFYAQLKRSSGTHASPTSINRTSVYITAAGDYYLQFSGDPAYTQTALSISLTAFSGVITGCQLFKVR